MNSRSRCVCRRMIAAGSPSPAPWWKRSSASATPPTASTRDSVCSPRHASRPDQLELLQRNLLLSHAAGIGEPLPDPVVRLILALKINALARDTRASAWRSSTRCSPSWEHEVYPVIPAQGSVGASGDLAPLAHLSTVLLGIGHVRVRGAKLPAIEGLAAGRTVAAQTAGQRRPGFDQRHPGVHRAGAGGPVRPPKTCSPPPSYRGPCRWTL